MQNYTKGANLIQLVSPTPQLNKLKKDNNMKISKKRLRQIILEELKGLFE